MSEILLKMYISLHVKYRLFLSDFDETLNFLNSFSKNTQISNLLKIRPVVAELFRADRHDEANGAIRTFANAPNQMGVT
jgi:hypothetical protein